MKLTKIIGTLFIVVGLLFAVFGTIKYVTSFVEKDNYIYTTAQIVKIDKQETGDPEFPIKYTTYVELDINGEKTTTKLNTYNSNFKIGKQLDVCYLENDIQMVYEKESNVFFIIFAFVGAAFSTLGLIIFRKNRYSSQH